MRIYCYSWGQKEKARVKVNRAVRSGKLIPKQYCEICFRDKETLLQEYSCILSRKTPRTLFAHHPNYRFPFWVWWLCKECHTLLHSLQRECKIACITLPGAKQLLQENIFGVPGGYAGFLQKELEKVKQGLFEIEDKKDRLLRKQRWIEDYFLHKDEI